MIQVKEEAIQYVENQLKTNVSRLKPYVGNDKGWYYKRYGWFRVEKYIKKFLVGEKEIRWVIIPGLRGVGKTTILAQLFFSFQKSFKNQPKNILYFSVDEMATIGISLNDVFSAYEKIMGINLESSPTPILFFVDEIQQDPKWAAVLKAMFDRARNVFVVCTGSSAVQLQTNADVARRGIFEKLYPLSFTEYQMLKNNIMPEPGLKQKIKEALYDCTSPKEVFLKLKSLEKNVFEQWKKFKLSDFDEFLSTGTLPFTLQAQGTNLYERIELLIDRMVNKDIQELGKFDSQTLGLIKKLLFIMADSLDGFSINTTSRVLGLNRHTLTAILDSLEKAEILIKVPPYSSNSVSVAKKPSKYLFMTPAIRVSLLSITGLSETFLTRKGKLFEDIVGLHFYREFVASGFGGVAYDSAESGADFVLQISNKKQIAVEVGLGEKEYRQVKNTMDKIKCDYGLIICNCESVFLSEKDSTVKVPYKYFLLM